MTCCDVDIDALLLAPCDKVKTVVAVLLVDTDGRILIARRPDHKEMGGLWEFPGGKIEPGETPQAALVREIEEELGVHTCAGCLLPFTFASYRYEKFHLLMPVFICRQWEGTPQAMEGQELKWVRPLELAQYPMPAADVELVAFIRDHL